MESISPQRILEEAAFLLEMLLVSYEENDEVAERVSNNIDELKDLQKRLYMQGLYSV